MELIMSKERADAVGVMLGALPDAPVAMPAQELEHKLGLLSRLRAFFEAGSRPRGIGH